MATLADIAKRAGVSPAVVSRVVNGDASLRINQETRKRVQSAIADLDYAPNIAARALRSAWVMPAFATAGISNSAVASGVKV